VGRQTASATDGHRDTERERGREAHGEQLANGDEREAILQAGRATVREPQMPAHSAKGKPRHRASRSFVWGFERASCSLSFVGRPVLQANTERERQTDAQTDRRLGEGTSEIRSLLLVKLCARSHRRA